MLASRGISLALAGGAACLSWGLWAEADTPAKAPRTGQGRVTQVSATLPSDPATDAPAVIAPEAETLSPLDRLKARSAEDRARRITSRRGTSIAPITADPVGQARATLPTPDDLRSRRDGAPAATFDSPSVDVEPAATIPEAQASEAKSPEATALEATAPDATAPDATAPEATATASDDSVAELPLQGRVRRINESPLATFAPVTDDAGGSPVTKAPTGSPNRSVEQPTTPPKPAPVVTEFSPEEGTIPVEPAEQSLAEVAPVPEAEVRSNGDVAIGEESSTQVAAVPEESGNSGTETEPAVSDLPRVSASRRRSVRESTSAHEIESTRNPADSEVIEEEPLAALGSLPPHPEEGERAAPLEPVPTPRTMGSRRASLRQAEPESPMADQQPDREPTRDPRELKGVKTILPFKDYEPDEDILKADRCQNNCPRPNGGDCPDCKPGMSDDPSTLSCPECPEEVALNSPEFQLSFPTRSFPALDYRWEATNVWHYPLYFEDPELERYGHSRPFFIQPVFSAARFGTQFLLFPYRASLLPPWKRDYELGHYRPGRCVPYRYEVLPWNRSAAVWQAGVTTGAYFLFAPTP